MKNFLLIFFVVHFAVLARAQETVPDFSWSNSHYYNLKKGESISIAGKTISLLAIDHQFSLLKVDSDTVNLRVARRSLPVLVNGLQVFVADNRNVAALTPGDPVHGLLTGDALICVAEAESKWLAPDDFIFPVSFNHGFLWRGEEDSYMFSLVKDSVLNVLRSYPGIGIDLNDARGREKHWLVAIEESTVEWIETSDENSVCVCLSSQNSPGIYYVYDKLYNKNLEVRNGQKIEKGELIGTPWGDNSWGHVLIAVVYSKTVPVYQTRFTNSVNFFPQLFGLYYSNSFSLRNYFTKGKIVFGLTGNASGNTTNASAREEYLGKGWNPCLWNTAEKLDFITKGNDSNVRIGKRNFAGTSAECINPNGFCEYEINVRNGVYRIRARVGDVEKESWQKIEFDGIDAGTYALDAGQQKWTAEKVVKVEDLKLTVRVYFSDNEKLIAGLSELVFQQAY